jgi:hypothetical protein
MRGNSHVRFGRRAIQSPEFRRTQGSTPNSWAVWVVMHPWVRRNLGPHMASRSHSSARQRPGRSRWRPGWRVGAHELVDGADPRVNRRSPSRATVDEPGTHLLAFTATARTSTRRKKLQRSRDFLNCQTGALYMKNALVLGLDGLGAVRERELWAYLIETGQWQHRNRAPG